MNYKHRAITNKTHKKWYLIDAKNQILGRLSTFVIKILQGKDSTFYLPYLDAGNYVIIINARQIKVTGHKNFQKIYFSHSGKPGNLKQETFKKLQIRFPKRIIENSIKGMLPKGSLGKQLFTKLKIYDDQYHPHSAQKPQLLTIKTQEII